MKRIIIVTVLFLIGSGIFLSCANYQDKNTNEIPMYGGIPKTPEQQAIDNEFIESVVKQFGSKEVAAQNATKLAWQYFYGKNDAKTAMKRFNQAWLLDPNNSDAYYGFAFLSSLEGKTDEAILLYEKSLELNPNNPMALANLARSYKDQAYALYLKKRLQFPDREVKDKLNQALTLYEKAAQLIDTEYDAGVASSDNDAGYIYYQWAVALEFNGEYAKAWEKIKLCRKHDGNNVIEPAFIKELSRFMPEPN